MSLRVPLKVETSREPEHLYILEVLEGKGRQVGGADNCALLVVPNVKVIVGAQYSTFPFSFHDLLRTGFTINLEL
jgi:hypothetical protein